MFLSRHIFKFPYKQSISKSVPKFRCYNDNNRHKSNMIDYNNHWGWSDIHWGWSVVMGSLSMGTIFLMYKFPLMIMTGLMSFVVVRDPYVIMWALSLMLIACILLCIFGS